METSRNLPNSVSGSDEVFTDNGGSYVQFYPEDVERMKTMTPKESIRFKRSLIKSGKYEKDLFDCDGHFGSRDRFTPNYKEQRQFK